MKKITGNWNFMRVLRLVLGIAIIIQAVIAKDLFFGLAGVLFTSMPIFNIGCCSSGSCYVPQKKSSEVVKDISYEEIA